MRLSDALRELRACSATRFRDPEDATPVDGHPPPGALGDRLGANTLHVACGSSGRRPASTHTYPSESTRIERMAGIISGRGTDSRSLRIPARISSTGGTDSSEVFDRGGNVLRTKWKGLMRAAEDPCEPTLRAVRPEVIGPNSRTESPVDETIHALTGCRWRPCSPSVGRKLGPRRSRIRPPPAVRSLPTRARVRVRSRLHSRASAHPPASRPAATSRRSTACRT